MADLNFFDAGVMDFVQRHLHNAVTDALFPMVTYLGELGAVWVVLAVVLLFFPKTKRCGGLMLLSMLAAFLVGEVFLKNVVDRPRPFQTYPGAVQLLVQEPASWSFPSGHSAASFAAATVVFAYFRRWGAAALVLAALIAFSRVFLFVHYPTDVLAGAALGALCALGVLAVFHKLALPHLSRWKK